MKTTLGIFIALAVSCVLPLAAKAQLANLDVTSVSKKVDKKSVNAAHPGDTDMTREEWEYVVTVENKDFKDITGLEVKYIIFYKQEQLGSKAAARLGKQSGSATIAAIKGHDKNTFETATVKLVKASLSADYYFANGAKSEAQGNLVGIWVRIYQGTTLVAEVAKPVNLPSKEKWE